MLLEFLERHRARHLFRSSHLNSKISIGQLLQHSSKPVGFVHGQGQPAPQTGVIFRLQRRL